MFDAILYINLEYREDRRQNVVEQLSKLSHITTNIHRIDAVLETWCGHLGCGKSHVKAIELAIEHDWSSVLIVEDDVKFVEDITKLAEIDKIEWDVMMLGHGHKTLKECDYDFLKRVTTATCTHAYIIRKHYYQTLLDNFKGAVQRMTAEVDIHKMKCKDKLEKLHHCSAIDQSWFSLQRKDTFYTFEPQIAIQNAHMASDNNSHPSTQLKLIEAYTRK